MGTHEARPRGTTPASPAPVPPPVAAPALAPAPPVLTAAAPPSAPYSYTSPAPFPGYASGPPSAGSTRSSSVQLEAPQGSSGLVPARGGVRPAASLGAQSTLVQTVLPSTAPTKVRWDEKRARTKASATTFGLTGRIVITAVVVVLAGVLSIGNPFGIPVFLLAGGWLLRDLWSRARTAPPRPPMTPERMSPQPRHAAGRPAS